MESYRKLKERHQKEFNELPLFFAFDDEQYKRGLKKVNATKDTKIVQISGACYCKASDVDCVTDLLKRHQREHLDNMLASREYIYNMISYELANKEYQFSRDLDDVLSDCVPDEAYGIVPNISDIIKEAVKDYEKNVG
ncbi:hypothetical protein [Staphylococcus epidermidis]|uniref:DUF7659 family protein n=1 Tax=Staphylococcus epidermidis TaxID=1282 RepID=UPI002302CAFE|nr:hypothetical protein [Staphylococcus epidermidis]